MELLHLKMESMSDKYGEPNDELGNHIVCEDCGHCITCGDCNCLKKYYVTSDMHFSHELAKEKRGMGDKTIEEYNNLLIERWNKIIKSRDIVYHIGDFSFSKNKKNPLSKLNGTIYLIKGNHDPQSLTNITHMVIKFRGKDLLLVHNPEDAKNFPYKYVIHGHIHKGGNRTYTPIQNKKYFNVNTEYHKFRPILINQVLGELENN